MTTAFAIQTTLEFLAIIFVIYGLIHEDKFIAFEAKLAKFIKRKIYLYKRRKAIEKRRQQGSSSKATQLRRTTVNNTVRPTTRVMQQGRVA